MSQLPALKEKTAYCLFLEDHILDRLRLLEPESGDMSIVTAGNSVRLQQSKPSTVEWPAHCGRYRSGGTRFKELKLSILSNLKI